MALNPSTQLHRALARAKECEAMPKCQIPDRAHEPWTTRRLVVLLAPARQVKREGQESRAGVVWMPQKERWEDPMGTRSHASRFSTGGSVFSGRGRFFWLLADDVRSW